MGEVRVLQHQPGVPYYLTLFPPGETGLCKQGGGTDLPVTQLNRGTMHQLYPPSR